MSSTELVPDSAALAAKEQARIILQNSTSEAAATQQPIDRPLRSESPGARTIAGDVRRRTDRTTNAEAPPPSKSNAKSSAKQPANGKGKGRQNRGLGNGGDSDSDSDEKRLKKKADKDDGGALKRPLPVVDIGGPGPSDRTYGDLSAEEQQAIQLRRAITAMDRRWAAFGRHYQECKSRSTLRGPVLIAKTHLPYASLTPSEDLQLKLLMFEKYIEEYQTEALFGHIKDQEMENDATDNMRVNSDDDHLEDVLLSVEDELIRRCSAFSQPIHARRYSKVAKMSGMIERLQEELWEEVKESVYEGGRDVAGLVARFMSNRCPRGMTFDLLAEQYFRILSEGLLEGVVAQMMGLAPPTLILVQEFEDSRGVDNELTLEYMNWAITVLDRAELAKRCKNWSRDKAVKGFRSIFMNCRQEFVEDPDDTSSESTVSLVLFKGNKLVNTQPVSTEDLCRMGWCCQNPSQHFWRYQVNSVTVPVAWQKYLGMDAGITGTRSEFDVILKVRMDREVIGIFTPGRDVEWTNDFNELCDSLGSIHVSRHTWGLS